MEFLPFLEEPPPRFVAVLIWVTIPVGAQCERSRRGRSEFLVTWYRGIEEIRRQAGSGRKGREGGPSEQLA